MPFRFSADQVKQRRSLRPQMLHEFGQKPLPPRRTIPGVHLIAELRTPAGLPNAPCGLLKRQRDVQTLLSRRSRCVRGPAADPSEGRKNLRIRTRFWPPFAGLLTVARDRPGKFLLASILRLGLQGAIDTSAPDRSTQATALLVLLDYQAPASWRKTLGLISQLDAQSILQPQLT